MNYYVLTEGAVVGNKFAFWGFEIPEGRAAVVTDCELANGGCGPCVVTIFGKGRPLAENVRLAEERARELNSAPL